MPATHTVVSALTARTTAHLQLPGGWFHNNSGWITGTERTLLVDTCATEQRSRHLVQRLCASVGTRSVPDTVLTHAHGDHANGAGLLARAGATVHATDNADRTVRDGPHVFPELFECADDTWGDIAAPARIEVVDSDTELDLGGSSTVHLVPTPFNAHTDGDLLVWVPSDGVLFTGDVLFNGVTPLALHGSIAGWLSTLDWVLEFGARWVVPGHGPLPAEPATLVRATHDYLSWLLEVTEHHAVDLAGLCQRANERWPDWHDPERHAVNLRRAHAENHGHEFDINGAAAAMLQAAGGRITLDLEV